MYCSRYVKWLLLALVILCLCSSKKLIQDALDIAAQQVEEEDERFITYLPHSGLHNQRIALINAMLLAKALDRTLLMPEINLGHAIYWRPSSTLSRQLDICPRLQKRLKNNKKKRAFRSLQCSAFKNYVPVSVDSIFDISAAQELGIRTEQRLDMKRDYLKRHNKLFTHFKRKGYKYSIPDSERYSYQLHDGTEDDDTSKFVSHIEIEHLRQRPERYIEFGSLFSTTRLSLNQPELIWTQEHLHREIGTRHPLVKAHAQKVISKLGGKGRFISVHLRQGDGIFKHLLQETLTEIEGKLQLKLNQTDGKFFARGRGSPSIIIPATKDTTTRRLEKCLAVQDQGIPGLDVIFLATDAPKPRMTLKTLFHQYPCTFTLADFPTSWKESKRKPSRTNILQNSQHVKLGYLLYPMMDAEIASHASLFIGTPKSTYSSYVNYRNQHNREHCF
ncbi:hypothetical protein K501DRAFT_255131 [Backusella circina FSU 941]|nr:hypothetical protein K501DRAFT_255131 [Backusella circina FSU 941]